MPYCCPAKVNLILSVDGLLPGGFHAISTVMQKIGLCDELEAKIRCDGTLTLARDIPATADPKDDLVMKSAKLLKEYAGKPDLGADILLKKRIPTGAGLGGGSSDAAGTLVFLNGLWKLGLKKEELFELALSLGSDVPFFLGSPASFCRGRGEVITELKPRELFLVVVKPSESLPTAAVYRKFDERSRDSFDPKAFLKAYESGSASEVGAFFGNALEAPAAELEPKVGAVRRLIEAYTPYVSMSGSGSAFFGLFKDLASAAEAASSILEAHPDLFVCAAKTLT
ncbi:4-(cytidine 5'-diphospho)-2-C-methyl-D-erythritol kinase [bacterium]|nr:4-(cytidine 5'-diphospho)-2-C-methyl-D-erythritol kinase [bacterium]